jgi:hemerythrin
VTCEDAEKELIVEWDDKYRVGIPLIDEQHQKLIEHTNILYRGCLVGTAEEKKTYFMETVKTVVDYTRYHFSAEERMLEKIQFPQYAQHKKEHEYFVQTLLDQVKGFQNGVKFAPNNFVRFLRDWILSHIAMEDTKYARYILDLKKSGHLGERLKT